MSAPVSSLSLLAEAIASMPDPRSKQGVSHPYHGMVALILLGLLAQIPYVAQIKRWAKRYWKTLKDPLKFKKDKPPVETTIFRALAKTTVADFQEALSQFLQIAFAEEEGSLTGAVDGKVAKQMKDTDGEPLLILNCLIHDLKVALPGQSVHGDKTNEPGSLKAHIASLTTKYPMLKLLTGDAIFAQRPLLEVLQEQGLDYLFQIKDNQPDILDVAKTGFAEVDPAKPDHAVVKKRGSMSKCRKSGAISKMRSMSVSG